MYTYYAFKCFPPIRQNIRDGDEIWSSCLNSIYVVSQQHLVLSI